MYLWALIVKFNYVFLLRQNMHMHTKHVHACAHGNVVPFFFQQTLQTRIPFSNLNGDWRKPLCLTKHFHFSLPVVSRPPPTPIFSVLQPGPFIGSLQHCLPAFRHIPNGWRPLMDSSAFSRRPEKPSLLDALARFLRRAVRLSTLRFDCKPLQRP